MMRFSIYLLFILLLFISPFFGSASLHVEDVLNSNSLSHDIFFSLRVPRVLFAFAIGGVLGLCGMLYQSLFRNPLMSPYTLGISSGAVLGVGMAIKLGVMFSIFGVSLFGFAGALGSVFLLLYLSQFLKYSKNSILLLGIALSIFYTSALMVVFYLGSPVQNDMILHFSMGSLSVIGWDYPLIVTIALIVLVGVIYMYRFELQLLGIDEEMAKLKGVDVKKTTTILLVVSSFAIALVVSMSGPIGFVGLVVPHIVTKFYPLSVNHRIFQTALFGGFFLVFCDTISRVLQSQSELPVGIVSAFLGVPFFIYLIIKASK